MFADPYTPSSLGKSLIGTQIGQPKDFEKSSLEHARLGVDAVSRQNFVFQEEGPTALEMIGQVVGMAYDMVRISQTDFAKDIMARAKGAVPQPTSNAPTGTGAAGAGTPAQSNMSPLGGGGSSNNIGTLASGINQVAGGISGLMSSGSTSSGISYPISSEGLNMGVDFSFL